MQYKEYLPSTFLRPYVDCYWHYQLDKDSDDGEPLKRCLPLGTIEIIVQINQKPCEILKNNGLFEHSANIYFTGLYTDSAYWKAPEDTFMFGIRLKPESLIELFSLPVSILLNSVVDAENLLGSSAKRICDEMSGVFDVNRLIEIAEKYLLARLWNLNDRYNHVVGACRLIRGSNGTISIEALSEKLYVSKRQLERCFKDQLGASPKTYQRIIRFRNAYLQVRSLERYPKKWTEISYTSGYADQAHFIRDFKSFTGEVPSTIGNNSSTFFQTLESSSILQPY